MLVQVTISPRLQEIVRIQVEEGQNVPFYKINGFSPKYQFSESEKVLNLRQ